jgi:hypothetical protein
MGTWRLHWAASLLAALGLPALAAAEEVVWRPARGPVVAASSAPDRGPAAVLCRPVPIASTPAAQIQPVSARTSSPFVVGRPV